MTKSGTTTIALLAFAAMLTASGAAAQVPGGAGPGGGAGGGRGGMGAADGRGPGIKHEAPSGNSAASIADTVQTRLSDLQEDLKLTTAQRPAWAAYSDRVLKLLADTKRANDAALRGTLTGPQRLDQITDIARNRATAIEDVAEAGKALYAALTPEQQALADSRLAIAVLPMVGVGAPARERRGDDGPRPR
jgi:periplasmic protein CpxP/Spy